MADKIAIKDILELKSCSIEEFIHLASEKGITISDEENIELPLAELKVIDPSLAYKLRYKRPERQTTEKQPTSSKKDSGADRAGKTALRTLHALDSLGASANDVKGTLGVDSDFEKKSIILQELISMVD